MVADRIVFRSRPIYAMETHQIVVLRRRHGQADLSDARHPRAFHASIWDELRSNSDGCITRRIKISITDGSQLERDEIV